MQKSRPIRNTFYVQVGAYLLSSLTQVIGSMIDGVIIGSYLGVDAMAAFGLVSPLMVVFVLHGGTFEMALATSISYYVALGVLLLHFTRKERILRLVPPRAPRARWAAS